MVGPHGRHKLLEGPASKGGSPAHIGCRVRTVDHRFAFSNPALVSAPSKNTIWALRTPCGDRNGFVLQYQFADLGMQRLHITAGSALPSRMTRVNTRKNF